ncbi:flagellar FliJ protein [Thermanaeromonas toyohensis ToBE]|uniref:Flagellar FliJ protein n=1 Tax=Thermanaeromonas toyohensis ToBE TaxID=698762 RepID=A0A1W1VKT3_9FIRM|nr:flagellar export protein FliJ [Thermanaeromonas toyohensis]SMB93999.1 flagellar FliJ protein [Thermanaeromonas toyohensis ToBE]
MPTFRFSLQKVHNYRKAVEEQHKKRLALAQKWQEEEERSLQEYLKERAVLQDKLAEMKGPAVLEELWQRELILMAMEGKIEEQGEKVAKASAVVEEYKGLVLEARQARKVLDSLKARQEASFRYTLAREEQKELDDIAAVAYNRKEGNL